MPIDIFGFLRDSFCIMLAWLFLAISFFSWGHCFAKILNLKISSYKGIIAKIWLGWVFGIFFYTVYNLFLPINAFASCIFYFPAFIFFIIKYLKKVPGFIKPISLKNKIAIILTLFIAATVSIQLPMNFDTGLYHFNNIRWANEHHIIKGLGNLHTRLGFNQSFFLYSASLNFHPYLNDYAYHVANSFLYALFCISMILGGTIVDYLLLALFFYIPMPYFWINNPTPDMASTLVQITAFRYFIEVIYYKNSNKINIFAFVGILLAVMVSLKLSNAVLALGLGLIIIFILSKSSIDKTDKKLIKSIFSFIAIYFIIWVLRGYIQTGYPLFPSSIGRIDFDWTVPLELTNKTEKEIYAYAKLNNYDYNSPLLNNWGWIDSWLKESFFNVDDGSLNFYSIILMVFFPMTMIYWGIGSLTLLIVSLLLFTFWLISAFSNKNIWNKSKLLLCLFTTEIISILFWFFTAPNPRFANGIFVLLFTTVLILIKVSFPKIKVKKDIKNGFLFYSFFMFLICFCCDYSNDEFTITKMQIIRKINMNNYVTNSGLKILVPAKKEENCWDSDLPSTTEPNPYLALRGQSIDDGFCIKK